MMYFIKGTLKAQWLFPEIQAEVLWDFNTKEPEESLSKKAMNHLLEKTDVIKVMEALKTKPNIVIEWGFTPKIIPFLIESNIELCYQLFFCLNEHPDILEYYEI